MSRRAAVPGRIHLVFTRRVVVSAGPAARLARVGTAGLASSPARAASSKPDRLTGRGMRPLLHREEDEAQAGNRNTAAW